MDPQAKVYDILKNFSTAMMVTTGPGKRPEARPMHIAKLDEGGDLWFLTSQSGRIVAEIGDEPLVLLVFQDERNSYLSVRARARVVQDHGRVKEIWKEPFKVWFPGGVEDPEIALLAVTPVSAEYWDNSGLNKLSYLFEAAKAYIKGEKPAVGEPDLHAKVSL